MSGKKSFCDHEFELVRDELIDTYCYGQCMFLAIALHRILGSEIEVAVEDDGTKSYIAHAWIRLGDGHYLDAIGMYKESSELESFGERTVRGLDEEKFVAGYLGGTLSESDQASIVEADKVARKYLIPRIGPASIVSK